MNYQLLQELFSDLEDFEKDRNIDQSKATKADFIAWMKQDRNSSEDSPSYPLGRMPNYNSVVLKNLVYLVRFVQQYAKELWPMFSI